MTDFIFRRPKKLKFTETTKDKNNIDPNTQDDL